MLMLPDPLERDLSTECSLWWEGLPVFSLLPISPWGVLEISILHPPRFNPHTLPSSCPHPSFPQPMEIFVDDETKLTLHGLQQYYVKLKDNEKNRKLFDLLDVLEFNQVSQY